MKNALLLIALLSLVTVGCDKDDDSKPATSSNLTVTFKATFDGVELEKQKDFMYGSYPVHFDRYTQYISDLALVKSDGSEVKLSEVEFLEFFPDFNSGNLSATPQRTYANVPLGDYTGLKIGVGVRTDLNAKKPSDFPAGTPLALENEYWLSWKSYIFSKIEAKAELDGTGNDYETFLNYHSGSATSRDIYKAFSYTIPISVTGPADAMTLELDMKKLFTGPTGKLLDLNVPENQYTGTTPTDLGVAEFLRDNWPNALSVK
ncbi:MAG: MbnP family protein [Saprospiraceae bacterium]